MTIPELRKRLSEMTAELRAIADELDAFIVELRRRPIVKRAPATSTPMSPGLARELRAFVRRHPDMSNQKIAEHFNVNSGRVTDAMRGKRT